jgi:hypothetical protein
VGIATVPISFNTVFVNLWLMCLFAQNSHNFDKSSKALRPVPAAARSEALVYGRYLAGIAGSNSGDWEAWMSVCCECCVLSGTGLCDGLITRTEKSYRLWCV